MHPYTREYNAAQAPEDRAICALLAREIHRTLPEADNRLLHGHPVWFVDGNPVVGYSKEKGCVRLLFWSGQSFDEDGLKKAGRFKAAEARYTTAAHVNRQELRRWLTKARTIRWDYITLAAAGVSCGGPSDEEAPAHPSNTADAEVELSVSGFTAREMPSRRS